MQPVRIVKFFGSKYTKISTKGGNMLKLIDRWEKVLFVVSWMGMIGGVSVGILKDYYGYVAPGYRWFHELYYPSFGICSVLLLWLSTRALAPDEKTVAEVGVDCYQPQAYLFFISRSDEAVVFRWIWGILGFI